MQYDRFQQQAIEAINAGKSVLVSAPTGAGKTAIAEYAIDQSLPRGERVVYTAPVKALSNQKFRDFSAKYPDQVGLLTGDVTLNANAPLLIMTTEIYRNQLFEDPERLASTRWVIFDEVHYLDDPERGTVWEEAMMFSPPQVRFLALSATAPNIEEVAEWIDKVLQRPIEVVLELHRPVPLVHHFQCQNVIYPDTNTLRKGGYMGQDRWAPEQRFGNDRGRGGQRNRFQRQGWAKHLRAKPNRVDELIRHLMQTKRLPCLYFGFGRKRVEQLAWEQIGFDFLDAAEKAEIIRMYDELCQRFELAKESSAHEMKKLVHRGIGFHHAGMLPTLKEVIERLFTSKLIKLIFTTETFAIGINMPAKSVAFDELRKFHGTHFGFLQTRDFYQMAGRAGRRGMDKEGYVYTRVNPHQVPFQELQRIVFGKPEPIESQFNSCYATLLNLYGQFGERLMEIYPRSFHHYQTDKRGREKGAQMLERKLALLTETGYMKDGSLTVKGEFASWMYGYELILSEMLEDGYLETLNESMLGALLVSLTFEPRRNQDCPRLSPSLKSLEKQVVRYGHRVEVKEEAHKVWPRTRMPQMHLAPAIEAWIAGCRFHELGQHTDVDEGEIIRHFRMVVQLLRQLKQAPRVSDALRQKTARAMKAVNRDLVDAEKQLRNMEESESEGTEGPETPAGPQLLQ